MTEDSISLEEEEAEYQVPNSDPVPVPGIYQVPPSKPVPVRPQIATKPSMSKETSSSVPAAKGKVTESRPSTNVRDLIAKLNQSDIISPRSSVRQPSIKKKPLEMANSSENTNINKFGTSKTLEAEKKSPFLAGAVETLKSQLMADTKNDNKGEKFSTSLQKI